MESMPLSGGNSFAMWALKREAQHISCIHALGCQRQLNTAAVVRARQYCYKSMTSAA
jgi:hypothetical protein